VSLGETGSFLIQQKNVFLLIVVSLIIGCLLGFWVGAHQSGSEFSSKSFLFAPTPTLTSPPSAGVTTYRESRYLHVASPLNFLFEYPYGWHVMFSIEKMGIPGKPTERRIESRFVMDPNPLTTIDYTPAVIGREIFSSKEELNEETYPEYILRWYGGSGEFQVRDFRKASFSLQENIAGFCYTYYYSDPLHWSHDVTGCCLDFKKASSRMHFSLNNPEYFAQFKHFIESIKEE